MEGYQIKGIAQYVTEGEVVNTFKVMVEKMFNGAATAKGALIIKPEKVIVTTPGAENKKDLITNGIVDRRSYDEIPPRVECSLTDKGRSVVPILQSICQWADVFYKNEGEIEMTQCQRCDYRS